MKSMGFRFEVPILLLTLVFLVSVSLEYALNDITILSDNE